MTTLASLRKTLFVASMLAAYSSLADVINQENFKTHLRWNLVVPRDQVVIVKRDQTLNLETLNLQLFETVSNEVAKLKLNNQYVESVSYSKENFPARPATVFVKLKDPSVELF